MKPKLLQVAGLKFCLNPARIIRLPFLRLHKTGKINRAKKTLSFYSLIKSERKQRVRVGPFPCRRKNVFRLINSELRTGGFLSGFYQRLLKRNRSFYPIFQATNIIFLDSRSLQAESFAWRPPFGRAFAIETCLGALLAKNDGLLLHAAAVVKDSFAYLFLGEDGSGKTTTVNLSKKYPSLDDDNIIIRFQDGKFLVYPPISPKGDRLSFRKEHRGYPLKAIFFIKKARGIAFNELPAANACYRLLFQIHHFQFLNDYLAGKAFATVQKLSQGYRSFEMRFTRQGNFWPALEKCLDMGRSLSKFG